MEERSPFGYAEMLLNRIRVLNDMIANALDDDSSGLFAERESYRNRLEAELRSLAEKSRELA